jgi:hypothetical protein
VRYLCLIYGDENAPMPADDPEGKKEYQAYYDFGAELQASGIQHSGEALLPTNTATTVRVRDGEVLTTDGPFAETKEQLGGFYLLDCKDLDEAIHWASKIPGARKGSIEVRPIMEFG